MWHKIKNTPECNSHVIYKLWYAGKYVIVGGRTMARSISNINIGLHYFFKDTLKGRNPNDVFYNFYCHVDNYPSQQFRVEILLDTEKPYQYLKIWHMELMKAQEDPKCLNLYFEPYIPQSTQKKTGSWLNRGAYLNYMKWKQKFSKKRIE